MNKKEFELVQKEIARRKGYDDSVASEEEKRLLKRVTGFDYDKLWDIRN